MSLENSLYACLIEYVVDLLNSLNVLVLVATHSPVVVDLVGSERTIVVERGECGGTRISRIKDQGPVEEVEGVGGCVQ